MSDKNKVNMNPDGDSFHKDVFGTNFPYFNARHTMLNDFMSTFKRGISGINPFAFQQIPNQKRIGKVESMIKRFRCSTW